MKAKTEKVTKDCPRKVRGVLTIEATDDMSFKAYNESGESRQEIKSSYKSSKLYETVGDKNSNMVAHLVIPKASKDPVSDLTEQLAKLTKGMELKKQPKIRGQFLLKEEECEIVLNSKAGKVEVSMKIDLASTPNYQGKLMNLMYKVNQCFAINQTKLVSARK